MDIRTNIDNLLDAEKRASDARRNQQQRIMKVVAVVSFGMIIVFGLVSFLYFQKELSKQHFYALLLYVVGTGLGAGCIEYIKIKLKGNQRSLLFELLQLALFIVSFILMIQVGQKYE